MTHRHTAICAICSLADKGQVIHPCHHQNQCPYTLFPAPPFRHTKIVACIFGRDPASFMDRVKYALPLLDLELMLSIGGLIPHRLY